jgi:uncharacterized RDD family membrane protein YckC
MSATPMPAPQAGVYAKAPTQVLGRRALALIIDGIIVSAIISPFYASWVHIDTGGNTWHVHIDHAGLYYTIAFFVPVLYWWILESAFGATIGKWICGIRVRTKDGRRAGVGRCFVRNIIRIVPFYWLVGWIVALASGPRRTRTFDMLAGTVVIRSTYAN